MVLHPSFSGIVIVASIIATPSAGQNEQFIPVLTYRTGAYAVSGIPYANGEVDYYRLINERDGGVNGVRLLVEECETGYATDRGLECYERLKGKGPTGAAFVVPKSTGVTLAIGISRRPIKSQF
jgi:branched-chain amino acid transport system substrate-binding protein